MLETNTTPDQRLARVCAKRLSPTLLRHGAAVVALALLPAAAHAGLPASIRRHDSATIAGSRDLGRDGRAHVNVRVPGHSFDLELEPSPVVAAGAQTIVVDERGEHRASTASKVFRGHVAGDPDSEVRVAFSGESMIGSIRAGGDSDAWFFEPLRRYEHGAAADRTIAYRTSDIDVTAEPGTCAAEGSATPLTGGSLSNAPLGALATAPLDATSAGDASTASGTATTEQGAMGLLELTVVADAAFYNAHGADTEAYMQSIIDQVAGFYPADIGITASIVQTVIYQTAASEPFSSSTSSSTLLSSLAQQRAAKPATLGAGDITHLFTGRDLDQNVIGIAYLGTVCDYYYAASLAQDYSTNLHLMTLLTGHEIGHSLGASHDGQSGSPCSGTAFGYVMWPVVYTSLLESFSACSQASIEPVVSTASCIGDAVALTCGDGALDANEQCDDGNHANGDCCRSDCQYESTGASCASDPNVCTSDICNGAGACVHPFNTAPCDDHDACSADGQCAVGTCTPSTQLAPLFSARLKAHLRGGGEDSLSFGGVIEAMQDSVPTEAGATVRFLDSAGGVLHESTASAAGWVNRNDLGTSQVFDATASGLAATTGGLTSMRVKYKPSASLAKIKVRMSETDLSFLEGHNSIDVQVLLGSATAGDCGTTLSLVCDVSDTTLACVGS